MDKTEFFQWFSQQVQPRWSKWPVNDVVLSDWHAALARFDPAGLTEAVREHLIRDDPSHPSLRRILELVTHRPAGIRRDPTEPGPPADLYSLRELSENIPEFFDPAQREHLMLTLARFHRDPRSKDPETYDRLAAAGRLPKPVARRNPGDASAMSVVDCARSRL
jgi:hypothetical protein